MTKEINTLKEFLESEIYSELISLTNPERIEEKIRDIEIFRLHDRLKQRQLLLKGFTCKLSTEKELAEWYLHLIEENKKVYFKRYKWYRLKTLTSLHGKLADCMHFLTDVAKMLQISNLIILINYSIAYFKRAILFFGQKNFGSTARAHRKNILTANFLREKNLVKMKNQKSYRLANIQNHV